MWHRFAPFAAGLAVVIILGSSSAAAQDVDTARDAATADGPTTDGAAFTVIPPDEDPLGRPYEDWAGAWWSWLMRFTNADDPGVVDNCQGHQGGAVFFIPNAVPGTSMASACTVGSDQHILVAGGATFYTIEDVGCETEAALRACIDADLFADPPIFSNVSVIIDGHAVEDIGSHLVVSPLLEFEYGEDNIVGGEPGTASRHMIGGWFIMLEPLPVGDHTIVARDEVFVGHDTGKLTAEFIADVEVVGVTD